MPKKRTSAAGRGADRQARTELPEGLETRLRAVWQAVGHLIDWCDTSTAWIRLFAAEARPYRETFYWESIARMVPDFVSRHPAVPPDDALSDCLIATQCPPSADDRAQLQELHSLWQQILRDSQAQIRALIEADLQWARQRGNYEMVAALYAGDQQDWLNA